MLQDENAPLSQIIEHCPFGILAVDAQLRLQRFSSGAKRMFAGIDSHVGSDVSDLLNDLWDPSFSEAIVRHFRHTLATGEPHAEVSNTTRRATGGMETYDWRLERIVQSDKSLAAVCYLYDVTDRRRWEAAVRESEARYRLLLSNIDEGYCLCEIIHRDGKPVDYRFLEANEHFSTATGLHDVIGKTAMQLVTNLESSWVETYARAALKGETFRFQSESKAMGRHFDVFVTPVEPRGRFMLVFSDITERLRSEDALRESERRFRTIADTAPATLWVTDEDHRATFLSRGWHDVTGQTEAEALGFGWMDAVHPEDRQSAAKAFLDAASKREFFSVDYRLRQADGSYRWAIDAGRPRFDQTGKFLGYIGSVIDVHERRVAEDLLRESEQRFRLLADNISQFAWIANADGDLFWYNQRWYDYTGTTFEQMKGWGWRDVHHPDHLDRVVTRFRHSIATGEDWQDEFPLRGADGNYRWFLSRALPIRDENGTIMRWFGTNTDVTEQRAAAEALRAADRHKDEFVAMLAHELRNPLSAIRSSVQILRHAARTNSAVPKPVVDVVDRQSQQLNRLIEDLLDVNRITRDKLELRREIVSLSQVIHQAIEMIHPAMESARHTLHTRYAREPINLYADRARLAQAIGNVLHNSTKYTPSGGNIWIETRLEGVTAAIIIRDDGLGIPLDQLQRVFELFAQVDRQTERRSGGLGIGLSLVKRMIELHGGSVHLHSDGEGKGCEVTLRVPVESLPSSPDTQPPHPSERLQPA